MDYDKEDATNEIENEPDDKTVLITTTQEGTSSSVMEYVPTPPFYAVTQQRAFPLIEAVWDLYLQLL